MKDKTYFSEVIIGVLVIIIISLCFRLLLLDIDLLPSWFFSTLFGGLFTLSGAFLGAKIAGNHAVEVMTKQQDLLKKEKINELNFEFRKRYANVQHGINFSQMRMKLFLQGKISEDNVDGIIALVQRTVEQLNEIPSNLISEEKYDSYILCIDILGDFETTLEWYKEGIKPSDGEIEFYKEELFKANNKLKE